MAKLQRDSTRPRVPCSTILSTTSSLSQSSAFWKMAIGNPAPAWTNRRHHRLFAASASSSAEFLDVVSLDGQRGPKQFFPIGAARQGHESPARPHGPNLFYRMDSGRLNSAADLERCDEALSAAIDCRIANDTARMYTFTKSGPLHRGSRQNRF